MIVQEDVPYTKEEVKAMVKTIHDLREKLSLLGWHPASELPKEDGEYITIMSNSLGEQGEICYNDFSNGEWSYTGYDWEPREVLLWIRKPKKE